MTDSGDGVGPGARRRSITEFDASYATTPPWDIGRPQPVLAALAEAGAIRGRVLDIGCGTGEHALLAAGLGLEAVGVDAAATAIAQARVKAEQRGLSARFLVGDALCLAPELGVFDTVLDCGLFHIFDDDDRDRYAGSLALVTAAGGRYFLLCFSEHQPGVWGPRRVTQPEIRAAFTSGWQIDSIEASRLEVTFLPEGVSAWRAALTRI